MASEDAHVPQATLLERKVDQAERRRRRVAVAAEELRALGAGDAFEGPVQIAHPYTDRCHELVDRIAMLTGRDVETAPLSSVWRFEWRRSRAKLLSGEHLFVDTPGGPVYPGPTRMVTHSQEKPDGE